MNILIDLRVLSTGWSGIAIYGLNLVKGLCRVHPKEHIRLLFYSPENYQQFTESLEEPEVPFTVSICSLGIYDIRNFFLLPGMLRDWQIDAYYTPQFFYPYRFLDCQTFISIHDVIPITHTNGIARSKKAKLTRLLKFCTHTALRTSSHIFFTSEHTGHEIKTLFADSPDHKTSVLYPGVWKPHFESLPPPPVTKPYLLYVGRLDPYKNVKNLIRAFHSLQSIHSDWDLIIAGPSDPRYPECKELVRTLNLTGCVHFTGFISKSDLAGLYQHATLAIQPSLEEGFGLTALEPLLYDTPVITSDIPVFRETFKFQQMLMFDPLVPDSIRDCIRSFINLNDAEKRDILDIQKQLLTSYTPEMMADSWLKTLQQTGVKA